MSAEDIIGNNIEDLVETIDVKNTTLWEKLIQIGLFESGDMQYIKVRFLPLL